MCSCSQSADITLTGMNGKMKEEWRRVASSGRLEWKRVSGVQGEGIGSTTGRGVISRDAITASLHQNRKRRPGKWGRSQPAGLVLRPCPHSPRRPPALCLPTRRLCPHRRCRKKRHQRHPPTPDLSRHHHRALWSPGRRESISLFCTLISPLARSCG